jgi:hypothetical protein
MLSTIKNINTRLSTMCWHSDAALYAIVHEFAHVLGLEWRDPSSDAM